MQLIADDDFEFDCLVENVSTNFDEELLNALDKNGVTSNQRRKVSQQKMGIAYGEDLDDLETELDDELENDYEMMDEMEDNVGQSNKCNKRHVSISKESILIAPEFQDVMNDNERETNEYSTPHVSISIKPISIAPPFQKQEDSQINLEPLTEMSNVQRISRRKRKLIIDQVKTLDKEKLEKQLHDSFDIGIPLDMAPPSKRLMILKEIGSFEKLLHLPGQKFGSIKILNLYQRHLRMRKTEENTSSSDEQSYSFHSPEHPRAMPEENALNSPMLDLNGCDFQGCINIDDPNHETSDSSSNDRGYVREDINANKCQTNFSQEMQDAAVFSQEPSEDPDRILQKRITSLLHEMRLLFQKTNEIKFSDLVKHDRRVKVAGKFQSLLLLKKLNIVEVMQRKCYEEIFISKGTSFTPLSSQNT